MLLLPWRNEEQDILSKNCEQLAQENSEQILNNYKLCNAIELDLNSILEQLEN